MRHLLCSLALLVAPATAAQDFPEPGTGVFTWEPVGRPVKANAIAFSPGDTLYAVSDTALVYEPAPAAPLGGRWRALGRPRLGMDAVLPLGADGDTLLVGRANGGLMSRSLDGGRTWADVNGDASEGGGGGPNEPGGFLVLSPGHSHAGRILSAGETIYSDDRGATWTDAARSFETNAFTFAALPSGRVLVGGAWGAGTSDDGGASYTVTPLYGISRYLLHAVAPLATPGSAQTGAPSCGLTDGALCDGAVAVGTDATAEHVRAWRTSDGGRTWSLSVALPQPYDGVGAAGVAGVIGLLPGPDGLGRALAVLGRGLVYRTTDGAQTWEAIGRLPVVVGQGGSHRTVHALLGPDGHLWVATSRNGSTYDNAFVFRSAEPAEAAFPVASEDDPESGGVRLNVRPNPSDGLTTVHLSSVAPGTSMTVEVYDAIGRLVISLHEGPMVGGTSFALDSSRWPVGAYLVRAEGGGHTMSTRFVVAR